MIVIENLQHSTELDSAAQVGLVGGRTYLPSSWDLTYVVSETTNVFQQNPLTVNIGAGDAGIVSMGNFSPMLLSAGSAMQWLQAV